MEAIRIYAKTLGLFLLKAFGNYVWTKLVFLLIVMFETFILGATKIEHGTANAICLGIGIFMAFDTTYHVEGKNVRMWSKKFGFDLKNFNGED